MGSVIMPEGSGIAKVVLSLSAGEQGRRGSFIQCNILNSAFFCVLHTCCYSGVAPLESRWYNRLSFQMTQT